MKGKYETLIDGDYMLYNMINRYIFQLFSITATKPVHVTLEISNVQVKTSIMIPSVEQYANLHLHTHINAAAFVYG